MIVIPEKSLIFIHVPGTGGRSMENALRSVFPKSFTIDGTKHFPWSSVFEGYPEYAGFGFVRNPYERMVSFYRYMKNNMRHLEFTSSFEHFLREFSKVQSPLHDKFSSLLQKSYFEDSNHEIPMNVRVFKYDWLNLCRDLGVIFSPEERKQLQEYLETHTKIGCYKRECFTWKEHYTCLWMLDVVYMFFKEDFDRFECFGFKRNI